MNPLRLLVPALVVAALAPASALALVAEEPVGPVAFHPYVLEGALPAAGATSDGSKAPRNTALAPDGTTLQLQTSYVGRKSAEPTMGVDKDGNAFYAASDFDGAEGEAARTELYRSTDGGLTWHETTPQLPVLGDYPPATLDPYVYVDQSTSRLYGIELAGAGSFLTFSDDKGASWTESAMSAPGVNDHQTFFSGPPPAGATLPPSIDNWPVVDYYCVNALAQVSCSRSLDGGLTFTDLPAAPYQGCVGCQTGHGVVDNDGRVFLPRGDWLTLLNGDGPAQIAVSDDAATTWKTYDVSDTVKPAGRHTAVAVDRAGNVYYVWNDDVFRLPWLSISRDHGQTWSKPMLVAPPGVHDANFPMVVAGDAGRIAISFPGSSVDAPSDETRPWHAWVLVSDNALDAQPTFRAAIADDGTDPLHRGACDGRCAGMFDFIDLQISPKDGSAWATFTDTCTPGNNCTTQRKAGLATDAQGVAVRTVGGSSLLTNPAAPQPAGAAGLFGAVASAPAAAVAAPRIASFRVLAGRARWRLSAPGSVRIEVRRGGDLVASITSGRPARHGAVRLTGVRRGDTVVLVASDAAGHAAGRARAVAR